MCAVPVMEASGVDMRTQHEPARIHQQVALPPREPLGSIVSALRSSNPATLDGLTVDHRCARVRLAPFRLAHRFPQTVVGPV